MLEIIAAGGILFGGFILGRIPRKPKVKHDHIWVAKGVHQVVVHTTGIKYPTGRHTNVLETCFCGNKKTTHLTGHWTIEQLTE